MSQFNLTSPTVMVHRNMDEMLSQCWTSTGWRNELTGTSRTLTRRSAKSCTWRGTWKWSQALFSARSRGNGNKLKCRRLPLNIRKHFLLVSTGTDWPGRFGFSIFGGTKKCLNMVWDNWFWVVSQSRELNQVPSRGPFQPKPFCDSV